MPQNIENTDKNNYDNAMGNNVNSSNANNHVSSNCRVALQTAQAVIEGKKRANVRVLFDSGSHGSFVPERAVSQIGINSVRKEWIDHSDRLRKTVG